MFQLLIFMLYNLFPLQILDIEANAYVDTGYFLYGSSKWAHLQPTG